MTMAATTDQQISLTVVPRGSSSHLSRPARQLVPAFLQKLYEMVNDPADQDLIRWSDTGDSFFVLDQERFANEVLGRWFKHKRFSSFVRQLNMYGFHKIPHLQQGVLRAESDTEFWNFEHPHFLRGQPDLLCLIQRKKPPATPGDDVHTTPPANKDAPGNVAVGPLSTNQLLDINSIVNGIQVIKRHQAAISADLNELKSSNQLLWQEAMIARERHKKHQDTINRILKFLAGVFGHADNQMRKDEDTPHAVVTRQPQRLMIADGRSGQQADTSEVAEEESRSSMESARSTNSTDLFGSLDTPSAQPSESFTSPRFASVEPSVTGAPTPVATEPHPVPQETQPPPITLPGNVTNTTSLRAPATTTTTPSPSQPNNDSIVQTALTSVLNSPTQMHKLLAALAAQSISPDVFPSAAQPHSQQHLIAPPPYNSNSQQYAPSTSPGPGNIHPNVNTSPRLPSTFDYTEDNALSPFTLPLLEGPSEPDPFALQQQDDRLQKSYKTAAEINNDVDELQTNIQSLIQSLGIDPTTLDISSVETATGVGDTSVPAGDMDIFPPVNLSTGQDFDFDSFLMDMPRANEEDGDLDKLAEKLDPSTKVPDPSKIGCASSQQLHAFLDEVASQDGSEGAGAGAGVPELHGSQAFKVPSGAASGGPGAVASIGASMGAGSGTRGRKRKSDVMLDGTHTHAPQGATPMSMGTSTSSIIGNKSKRKR
ncbi:hypothetical protein L210DRAFT_3641220 [Boletus edulis BED1]|uniref:HSF-type DNA-binding domain-containing protein n=1 Tax=Boletus edulis BED1 TaxID=1328754 RepID=A0AAD4C3F8_BOLED|nr:hypothetical protein L210DRAFT_3641220 [Boletus edulis BED1]